jgi:V/A-type H+-transporting ATPase subunit I
MLKPVSMKKLSAVILEEKKEPVLRELKEQGLLQFIDASESDVYRDLKLARASPSWIHVEASELLSRINNIFDAFKLLKKDRSFLQGLLPGEVEKAPVEELPPKVFFEEMQKKVKPIEERVKRITAKLEDLKKEKEELEAARQGIALIQRLGIAPRDLRGYRNIRVSAGVLPKKELEAFQSDLDKVAGDYIMAIEEADKKNLVVLIAFLKEHDAEVSKILRVRRFDELQLPFRYRSYGLEEALAKIEEDSRRIEEEERKFLAELGEIEKAERLNLLRMRELLQIEKYLDETNQLFGRTAKTYLLRAWVPYNYVENVVEVIKRVSQGYCTITIEDPAEGEEPPTLLSNPSFATPVELLTTTYGTPPYHKIDPTLMMTISFPVMFGFMFGDVGQGLVLALIGLVLGFYLKLEEVYRKFGRIIFYCGAAAVVGGFLYGSVFGLEGEHLKHYFGFELHPLWLSPLRDVSTLITFALVVGLVQLSLGCFLNIANHIRHNPLEAVFSPWGVVGLWLFWGGAFLLKKHGADIFALFKDPLLIPAILLPLVLITVGVKYAEAASLSWGIYTSYEAVTRYLFNGISYIRVIALALVHAALSSVMVMLMLQFPTAAIPIFIGGNLVIFIMEAVISFIQTLRLHYYEWFSKFYEGRGMGFKAFKVMRKYTFLAPLEVPGISSPASR